MANTMISPMIDDTKLESKKYENVTAAILPFVFAFRVELAVVILDITKGNKSSLKERKNNSPGKPTNKSVVSDG